MQSSIVGFVRWWLKIYFQRHSSDKDKDLQQQTSTDRRQVTRDATDWPTEPTTQKKRRHEDHIPVTDALRVERAQQPRGDRREVDTIADCWRCRMMAENLFSKTIIWQRQRFAEQTSTDRRQVTRDATDWLTEPPKQKKRYKDHIPVTDALRVERAQQPRGDRREVDAIEDYWLWLMIVRKFIFKNNHRAKPKICNSRHQPTAD